MPRKSSFLSGFEVGSALYSRGYQQATQRRQMQLGEERDKRLEAQQKIQNKLAEQRMTQDDLRLRMLVAQNERLVKRQKKQDGIDNEATLALAEAVEIFGGENGAQALAANRARLELKINLSPKVRGEYDAWYKSVPQTDGTFIALGDAKRGKAEKIVDAANLGSRLHARNKAIREDHLKIFGGEEIDINDPDELVLAQVRIYENELQQFAIFQKVPLDPDWELTDINKDGKIDQDDVTAVKAERLKFGLAEAKRLGDEKAVKDAQADFELFKKKGEFTAGKQREARADVARLAKAAKALEALNQLKPGSEAYKKGVMQAALSGNDFSQLKGVMQPGMIIDIGRVRLDLQGTLESGKGPDGKPLTPYEKMKLSGVYTTRLAQSESETVTKTLLVREQIAAIEDKVFGANPLSTGKAQAKFTNILSVWAETDHGQKVAIVEGMLNAIMPGLARAIYGEVGVLTEADIELYKATFVSMGNTEDVNRALFDITKNLVDGQLAKTLNGYINNGKNVAGYAEDYKKLFPEKAAAPTTPQFLPDGTELDPSQFKDASLYDLKQEFTSEAHAHNVVNLNALITNTADTFKIVKINGQNIKVPVNKDQVAEAAANPEMQTTWITIGGVKRLLISPDIAERGRGNEADDQPPAEGSLQPVPSQRGQGNLPELPGADPVPSGGDGEITEEERLERGRNPLLAPTPEQGEVHIKSSNNNVSKKFIKFIFNSSREKQLDPDAYLGSEGRAIHIVHASTPFPCHLP